MEKIAENIYEICSEVQTLAPPLCVLSIAVIAVAFLLPFESTHNFAKKVAPLCAVGLVLLIGATYLGKEWAGKIVF